MSARKKPNAHKKLTGEKRPSRLNADEPSTLPTTELAYSDILVDAVALEKYERTKGMLDKIGVLSGTDEGALEMYAFMYSQIIKVAEQLEKEGRVVQCLRGMNEAGEHIYEGRANPLAIQLMNLIKEYRMVGSSLGLSPADRAKLKIDKPKEEDAFEGILNKKWKP